VLLAFDPWQGVADVEWAIAIVLFGIWYAWAARHFAVPLWRRACFFCGLLIVGLALLSPIEHLALNSMLSFHLLQNVMLADWAPPLLVLGLTSRMAAVAERLAAVRVMTRPGVAITYWLAVWYVVHIPGVYGYALDHRWALGIEHVVLERDRVAETWRRRWDSFRLNSTNIRTILPGDSYDGSDPWGAITHRDFVAFLQSAEDLNRVLVRGTARRPAGPVGRRRGPGSDVTGAKHLRRL